VKPERAELLHEAFFNGNGVARKLIVALVLFSAAITTLITAIELYADYRRDVGQINRSMQFIGSSYLPSLTDSVWIADGDALQTQLDGLLRLPDIEYIGIAVDGRVRWSAGQAVSQRRLAREVPLVQMHRGQPLNIGSLRIVGSVDNVLARLWDRLLVTLIGNGIKTLLVAGFMLLVFQYLVTRHLTHITAFVRGIDPRAPQGERLQLDRPAAGRWRPDMLDALEGSLNVLSRSLHESEGRIRQLFETMDVGVVYQRSDGSIEAANPAAQRILGMSLDQLQGRTSMDPRWRSIREDGSDFPGTEHPAMLALRTGQPVRDVVMGVFHPLDSTYRWINVSAVPEFHAGESKPYRVYATFADITARLQAQQQIRHLNEDLEARVVQRTAELQEAVARAESANRAKSEFLSRMSHELRTPMNAVLGFAQILEMSQPTPQQLKWASEIRRAGEHLLSMIEDLLDLASIEVGKMAIRVEALELEPVVQEAFALVQPMIDARGLRVERWQAGVPGPRVMADRLRLRQVLVNLLSNAAKYNRDGGSISVRCALHGRGWRVSVGDTGPGIDPQQLQQLFHPFERLGAQGGSVQGTGIGLSLSRQLATLMGASLGVESQLGAGSTFWVDLDAAAGDVAPVPSPPPELPMLGSRPLDVLYIEDDPTNIALFEAFVSVRRDVQVRAANNGTDGLSRAREQRPDVIVLDIQMPGMSGYEVLRALRADAALRDVPVIALSADAMPQDVQRGLAAGFDRYLPKPVVLAELLEALSALARPARLPEAQ
jgi:PAS domain S-box-containing protein